jgi:hypothetical protein
MFTLKKVYNVFVFEIMLQIHKTEDIILIWEHKEHVERSSNLDIDIEEEDMSIELVVQLDEGVYYWLKNANNQAHR